MSAQQSIKAKDRDYLLANPAVFVPLLQRNARGWMTIFLILTDVSGLIIATGISFLLQRFVMHDSPNPEVLRELLILPIAYAIISYAGGLYPAFGLNSVEELRRQTVATCLVFLSLIGLTFITKSSFVYSRFLFLSCWSFSLILLPLNRALLRAILPHFSNWGEQVVLIGPQASAGDIAGYLNQNRWIGLKPMAIFDNIHGKVNNSEIPVMSMSRLRSFCQNKRIDSAVLIAPTSDSFFKSQDGMDDLFRRIVNIPVFAEKQWLSGMSVMEYGDLIGFEIKHNLLDRWSQAYKRGIDIALSLLGMVILSPVFLIIALLILLDSPGRIFYRQTRIGKDGKLFVMVKFRTMQINAGEVLRRYLDAHPVQKSEWEQFQKLKNDPRITNFGKFMRRFSLDELPQLWNVLKGEMSLVGPRPILPDQFSRYGKSYNFYKRVYPGITGLWQISGRATTSFERRIELDNDYVSTWSLWLDILIIAKTFWVVLMQKGAY